MITRFRINQYMGKRINHYHPGDNCSMPDWNIDSLARLGGLALIQLDCRAHGSQYS